MKPKKKISRYYFRRGLEGLRATKWRILYNKKANLPIMHLEIEDAKVAANQIGFAFIMFHKKYPISPHTLKKEIISLDKKYKEMGEAINYLQEVYYLNKKPRIESYYKKIRFLYTFSKNFVKKQFPMEYKRINAYEKIFQQIDRKAKRPD